MTDRRVDHITRKRVSQMSPEEMRRILLTSEKTGLPNRRAFDEAGTCAFVAMADVNGLKGLNDRYGYAAGDVLIRRFAEILAEVGLDAYHEKGDEFLCRGELFDDLQKKLTRAQNLMRARSFIVRGLDGRMTKFTGADFCFGIGKNQDEAEKALKREKRRKGSSRTTLPTYLQRAREFCQDGYEILLTDSPSNSPLVLINALG
jgi:GGDEF domain-containing protein